MDNCILVMWCVLRAAYCRAAGKLNPAGRWAGWRDFRTSAKHRKCTRDGKDINVDQAFALHLVCRIGLGENANVASRERPSMISRPEGVLDSYAVAYKIQSNPTSSAFERYNK